MPRCALLLKAGSNRVYGRSAASLARAELAVLDRALGSIVRATEPQVIGGVEYLVVDLAGELGPAQLAVLSNLSSLHAAFALEGAGFVPLALAARRLHDEDLVTIQRYPGKTNEAFTHLLVNLALAASGDAFDRLLAGDRLRLLDPACGRGTTLHRATLYGMDAVGIEVDQRDVEALDAFFLTWLRDKRLKHQVERARLRKGRARPASRLTVTYGAGRDRAAHRVLDVVCDDTLKACDHLRPRSLDLLACDLPYGVKHGSRAVGGALARGPEALLEAALPVWFELLRPGAGVALAWNRRTLPRPRLVDLLTRAGYALHEAPALDDAAFVHRVDRAVTRDVVVAARPRA